MKGSANGKDCPVLLRVSRGRDRAAERKQTSDKNERVLGQSALTETPGASGGTGKMRSESLRRLLCRGLAAWSETFVKEMTRFSWAARRRRELGRVGVLEGRTQEREEGGGRAHPSARPKSGRGLVRSLAAGLRAEVAFVHRSRLPGGRPYWSTPGKVGWSWSARGAGEEPKEELGRWEIWLRVLRSSFLKSSFRPEKEKGG